MKENAKEVTYGSGYGDRILVLYMSSGVDLLTGILDACKANMIRSGLICYCIGSLKEVSFESVTFDPNMPNGGDLLKHQRFEGPIQVLSGQGCIGSNEAGELFAHLHITFIAGRTGTVFGCHINPGDNPVFN